MTPEEIKNVVKELNEIRDIANADVEKVVGYNTRLQSELDEARAEVKRFSKIADLMYLERGEARAEVERLKRELHDTIESYKLNNLQPKTSKPEPSCLEIAAMFYSAALTAGAIKLIFDPDTSAGDALAHADALIAASREDVDEATA